MKTGCNNDQLLAYLCGELNTREEQTMSVHLATCCNCQKELETVRAFWSSLSLLPQEQPSDAMRDRFYDMLQESIDGSKRQVAARKEAGSLPRWYERLFPRPVAIQVAVAILLLIGGGSIGYLVRQPLPLPQAEKAGNEELTLLHQEVLVMNRLLTVSLLQQQSASERLKGVTLSYRTEGSDPEITAALLQALKYDPNVNVRLAALDALMSDDQQSAIRQELIRSLPKQSSPLVQIEIVDWLIKEREKESLNVLHHMLKNPDVNKSVKQKIVQGIQELNS